MQTICFTVRFNRNRITQSRLTLGYVCTYQGQVTNNSWTIPSIYHFLRTIELRRVLKFYEYVYESIYHKIIPLEILSFVKE